MDEGRNCNRSYFKLALFLRGAEPLVVDLLIGAILTKRDQRKIDLSAQRAVQLPHDGGRRSAKFGADRLHPSLSLMRRIVKEYWSGRDHGIYFLVQESFKHLICRRELLDLCVLLPKIVGGGAVRYCRDLLTRQIARPLDSTANLLDCQGGR